MSFYREVFARIKIKAEFLEDFRHLYNEEYSEITNHWYNEMAGESYNFLETDAIKMEPDAYNVFSIISDKVDNGDVCGDEETIEINGLSIKLDIPDLQKWTSEYLWQVLVPCESGETTIEEINKTFDWKDFHERGLKLAYKVKELLPKNVKLRYASPFEDRSGIIGDEKWIE